VRDQNDNEHGDYNEYKRSRPPKEIFIDGEAELTNDFQYDWSVRFGRHVPDSVDFQGFMGGTSWADVDGLRTGTGNNQPVAGI